MNISNHGQEESLDELRSDMIDVGVDIRK